MTISDDSRLSRTRPVIYRGGNGGEEESRFEVHYAYNPLGYLTHVSNGLTGSLLWRADATDANGQLTSVTLGNGATIDRLFNPLTGRVSHITGSSAGASS